MRYTDIICSVCGKPFTENDDVVVCPVCGTPHHRTCWAREGHCANEALHEQGFAWQFPEDKDPLKQLDEQKKKAHSPAPDFSFKNGEKVVECPRCGALNYENDAFCMKCHAPLKERQNPTDPPQGAAWQQNNAPQGYDQADPHRLAYDNQRLYGGLDPNILIDGIPVAEYSDYIGGNAPGKIIRRIAGMERYDRKVSFNFAAFIFGPIWFFYRKMYRSGVKALVLITLLAAIAGVLITTPAAVKSYQNMFDTIKDVYAGKVTVEEYYDKLYEDVDDYAEDMKGASRIRVVAGQILQYGAEVLWCVCGLIADRLYRMKCKHDIEESRKACNNMADYHKMLLEKGGTSAAGAVVGVAATFASFIISQLPVLILIFTT